MSRLTFAGIKSNGAVIGGNDAVPTWIDTKLKAWLRKHYAAWPWPFLVKQSTGIVLASGLNSLNVGAGQGGLTDQISRLFSPIYFRANSFSTRSKAPIRELVGGPSSAEIGNVDPNSQTGMPNAFTYSPQQDAAGKQFALLNVYPYTDKQYTLSFTYQQTPDDPADTDVPAYPNEMTLIQAAKVAAIEYDNSNTQWYQAEAQILAAMVTADRDAYGGTASFGDTLQLDDNVYPVDDLPGTLNKMGW